MSVFKLVYLSHATPLFEGDSDLKSILEVSRSNNNKVDISGLLLYTNGLFIQLLEGKEDDVMETYNRIVKDPRHSDAVVVAKKNEEGRSFKNWSMGFIAPTENEINEMESFVKESQFEDFLSASNHPLLVMMNRIYQRNEKRSDL